MSDVKTPSPRPSDSPGPWPAPSEQRPTSRYCSACGHPIDARQGSCPQCGTRQPPLPTAQGRGSRWSTAAVVCGAIALIFIPLLFGPLGIALALVARHRGEANGQRALVIAMAFMGMGMGIGAIVGLTAHP